MEAEGLIARAGLAFFVVGGVLMVRSIRRGRALFRTFEARLPQEYGAAGHPFPGYFDSRRRSRYFAFLLRREYLSLSDPPLVAQLEQHRRSEMRFLSFLLGGFAFFAVALVLSAF